MYAKRIIIGIIVLILLGGVLTALYHAAGGLGSSAPASLMPVMDQLARTVSPFIFG